jgi:hypothetical protein
MLPAILTDICHDFPQSAGTNFGTVPSNRPWFPLSKPLSTRCAWSSPRRVPSSWSTGDNKLTNKGIFHMILHAMSPPPPISRTQLQFYNTNRQKLTLFMEQGSSQGADTPSWCRDISTFSGKRRFNFHFYRGSLLVPAPSCVNPVRIITQHCFIAGLAHSV